MTQKMSKPRRAAKKTVAKTVSVVVEHRGNRHGRSEEARTAILEAADNLLVERGFAGVTIEGIATAAGVAKQTIYRWWKSKTDVLMDAFLEDVAQASLPPNSGNLKTDLKHHLVGLAKMLAESDTGSVFRALLAEAQHDSELAIRLRTQFIEPQRLRDLFPFEQAVKRGELSWEFDTEAAVEQLLSPIYYRVLVSGQPISTSYVEGLIRRLLPK
ncbi:TetR/AcrR family transcriptional regulator [Granulicella arctica]|uniref:TetR/AcrR family transcriptional regulator n=1 Tax=Granulicella arctica TaxID=940613 RepID=UPI0021E0A3B4|nr:TetR/AcrR family transcriptional regulator [Granulicella arctica]